MLAGLDWTVMHARLADAPPETRARVIDLLDGIEAGAMAANAKGGADG
ncbi:MAG TPA: hypothetical protein PLS69_02580 [Terricaulis sp.]|nr:hypothetical protein [Terricaulis sp.]